MVNNKLDNAGNVIQYFTIMLGYLIFCNIIGLKGFFFYFYGIVFWEIATLTSFDIHFIQIFLGGKKR